MLVVHNWNLKILTDCEVEKGLTFCYCDFRLVFLPTALLFFVGVPYKRGFFCDDESIAHPFKESTIGDVELVVIGVVVPSLCVSFCDCLIAIRLLVWKSLLHILQIALKLKHFNVISLMPFTISEPTLILCFSRLLREYNQYILGYF